MLPVLASFALAHHAGQGFVGSLPSRLLLLCGLLLLLAEQNLAIEYNGSNQIKSDKLRARNKGADESHTCK